MADININGINLTTGQLSPLGPGDTPVNAENIPFLGASGIQGPTGPSGASGLQGITGSGSIAGPTGITGRTGIRPTLLGETGIQGMTGLQGITGTLNTVTGSQGITGLRGFTGIQGLALYITLNSATTLVAINSLQTRIIGFDTSGGPFTITLPLASTFPAGSMIVFQDEAGAAGSNNLTIATSGADLINGSSTYTMNTAYEGAEIHNTGSIFVVLAAKQGATGIETGATGISGSTGINGATGTQGVTGV